MFALLLALLPTPALAQTRPVITSAGPAKVAVTLYRDPERWLGNPIDQSDPSAFALIVETREVELPPGEVVVRFEGVAGGVVPQSAILFGTDPRERNRDAALLSQKGLVDGFTGQAVILRRTDPVTGKVSEERATIRSAAERLIVTTAAGPEAIYCSGLAQTLIYPGVPAGLSAKPVLTMTTRDQPGGKATVTLAYIATGFDWDATYVGTLSDDGSSLSLLAWLTMASGDETSFVDATASAVAGKIARSDDTRDDAGRDAKWQAANLNKWSNCWPAGRTHEIPLHGLPEPIPPPAPPPMMVGMMEADSIVVTARRREENLQASPIAVTAVSENLGDLKLYRIPVPVTVAARSQKQVAFLQAGKVRGKLVYRARVYNEPNGPQMLFRFRNRKAEGLGDPLPAGRVVLYQDSAWGRQVVGEAAIADKAVDEEVELVFGEPTGVTQTVRELPDDAKNRTTYEVTLRNANPFAVDYEFEFPTGGNSYDGMPGKLTTKPGKRILALTLAPGSERKLTYRVTEPDD